MIGFRTFSCLVAALAVLADAKPQDNPSPALWRMIDGTPFPGIPGQFAQLEYVHLSPSRTAT